MSIGITDISFVIMKIVLKRLRTVVTALIDYHDMILNFL